MKCPNCGFDDRKDPDHSYREFYSHNGNTQNLVRKTGNRFNFVFEYASIHGCPECKSVFIDTGEWDDTNTRGF